MDQDQRDALGQPIRHDGNESSSVAISPQDGLRLYRLLVESAKDHAIFILDERGHVRTWNSGAENLFGFSETEILEQHFRVLFTPEDRDKAIPETELRVAKETGRALDERYHLCKNGSRFYCSGVVRPLPTGGFVKIARDLSERKKMEEALREADRRKDEFLALLAHELRNPLAPIQYSLEIMKRTSSSETRQEAQAVIERQTNLLVRLVDDLLDFSRITRGELLLRKTRVSLREVVDLALESTRPLTQQHALQVSLPFKQVTLYGDKTRLVQVLVNLLSNAAKYTPAGGSIVLDAEREREGLTLRIRDTGKGIASENLTRIFDPFVQVEKGSQEGLGIGLNLVKQIVELHGGTVEALSPGLGEGSELAVRLPLPGAVKEDIDTLVDEKRRADRRPVKRVLVVDDDELNRETITMLLGLLGHEVTTAKGGKEGLELLETFLPDFVLLDLNMVPMTGLEVAEQIRENSRWQDIKLVALTGYGQEEDRERTRKAGFDAHLVKPVAVSELEALLDETQIP